jgi:hypothetical protein
MANKLKHRQSHGLPKSRPCSRRLDGPGQTTSLGNGDSKLPSPLICHITCSAALAAMHSAVACRTERDQILLQVGSRMAAELTVVHLKIRHRVAGLTSPCVATQDLSAQTIVRQGIQPRGSGFWANHSQDAFSRRFSGKTCCCSPGPIIIVTFGGKYC